MFDLIKFEFKRVISSPLIYMVLGLSLLVGVVSGASGLYNQHYNFFTTLTGESVYSSSTWTALSGFYTVFPIMGALYVTLFVGNDMSSGFLRNKLIAGHKRSHIFFSYVITQTTVALAELMVFTAAALLTMLIGKCSLDLDGGRMIVRFLVMAFSYISMIFLYTAFTLSVRRRALTIVFSTVFAISLSTVGLIATFGNYSVVEYSKYEKVATEAKTLIKTCLKDIVPDNIPSGDYDGAEDMSEYGLYGIYSVEDIDSLYDNVITPMKPFYYTVRVIYVVTDAGIPSDYGNSLIGSGYNDELVTFLDTYVNSMDGILQSFGAFENVSSEMNDLRADLKAVNTTVDYTVLNTVYICKTLVWSVIWLGGGCLIFRKKNIF